MKIEGTPEELAEFARLTKTIQRHSLYYSACVAQTEAINAERDARITAQQQRAQNALNLSALRASFSQGKKQVNGPTPLQILANNAAYLELMATTHTKQSAQLPNT